MPDRRTRNFDVAIIGAGPAGAAAAYTCRQNGLTVALIDKSRFPRDKLCGGLFTQRSKTHFKAVFGEDPPKDVLIEKDQAQFWHNGTALGEVRDFPPLFLTMRWDLDALMFQKACAAGAADFSGRRVLDIDTKDTFIRLDDGTVLTWNILIGADGVNSMVAKQLFGKSFEHKEIGFALEVEVPIEAVTATAPVRIDFAAAQWGYGWSFPKRKTVTVGVGGLYRYNPDMKQRLTGYLSTLGVASADLRFKGHFIPFGSFRARPGAGPVLLCGDAAGLVDPLTGEGIAYALQSGRLAGETAAQVIAQGRRNRAARVYRKKLKGLHAALRTAKMIRPVIFARRTNRLFVAAFRTSQTLKADYMRLLAGEIEYQDLGLRLLKRLPKRLIMALFR